MGKWTIADMAEICDWPPTFICHPVILRVCWPQCDTFRDVVRVRHLNAPPVVNSVDIAETTSQYISVLHITWRTIRNQNNRTYDVRHIRILPIWGNLRERQNVSTGGYNRIMYAPGHSMKALLWHDLDLPKYHGGLVSASSIPCDRENASVWYASLP